MPVTTPQKSRVSDGDAAHAGVVGYPLGKALIGLDASMSRQDALDVLGEPSVQAVLCNARLFKYLLRHNGYPMLCGLIASVSAWNFFNRTGGVLLASQITLGLSLILIAWQLYHAVAYLEHLGPGEVNRRMRRAGRCTRCGYLLAAEAAEPRRCTECGRVEVDHR